MLGLRADVPEESEPKIKRILGQLLLSSIDAFEEACHEMVSAWGTTPENRPSGSAQGLYRQRQGTSAVLLFSYRCFSTHPEYSAHYDERLAVLRVNGGAAYVQLIPVAKDCKNCSDLYHIRYSKSFPLEGAQLVELKVTNSSDNPCCDGPSRWKEERLLYILLPEAVAIFSLARSRERHDHDDVEGDREEVCRAEISYDLDDRDNLRGITSQMTCRIDGDAALTQAQHYRWLLEARRFEQVSTPQP